MILKSHASRLITAAFAMLGGLMVSIPSQALTVSLTGGTTASCTYTNITMASNGDISVVCAGGAPVPGTIGLSSPTYTAVANQSFTVSVTRTGGASGAQSGTVSSPSNCAVANGAVAFADGDSATKSVSVLAGATGLCTVDFALTGGATATLGTASASVTIGAANGPGQIEFGPGTITLNQGGTAAVTINRVGGTAGTVGATISTGGNTCTSSANSVNFTGSQTSTTVTLTGTAQGTCTVTLGNATGSATLGAPLSITVGAPQGGPAGCPAPPANMVTGQMGAYPGDWQYATMNSGQVSSWRLPDFIYPYSTLMGSLSQVANSPIEPLQIEITITRCPGDMIAAGAQNACRKTDTNRSGTLFKWAKPTPGWFATAAQANAYGYCLIDPADGPWYANIRYTYGGCQYGAPCSFSFNYAIADGRFQAP